METQVTFKGTERTEDVGTLLDAMQAKLEQAVPDARFAKYVVEARAGLNAVGLALTLADGGSWVRHGEGPDWERAFLELERRLDRLTEEA